MRTRVRPSLRAYVRICTTRVSETCIKAGTGVHIASIRVCAKAGVLVCIRADRRVRIREFQRPA